MKKKLISFLTAAALSMTMASSLVPSISVSAAANTNAETSDTASDATNITLGDTITVNGSGAEVTGNTVTITAAGNYNISGTLTDGQIIVNSSDSDSVKITLNGVNLTSSTSAPIYVVNADKTVITLAEGTTNYVTDASTYVYADSSTDEPDAAIFSKDDLTFKGTGSLIVNGNFNDGIKSKDDLVINGPTLNVTAKNDGIKGKDSVKVKDGNITVTAGEDGIKSTNDSDTSKGYVDISGGTLNITSTEDGIQAETSATVEGGNVTILAGGGSTNGKVHTDGPGGGPGGFNPWGSTSTDTSSSDSTSNKGIKAKTDLNITGGTININSADDALHSNSNLTISGGNLTIATGDDGVHSDTSLTIAGGDTNVTTAYEGIEAQTITVNDGTIHVKTSDDGFNASGTNPTLNINGGYIYVDADGDGLDANGSIYMTGGTALVCGPTNDGNGALDYDSGFKISGGLLVAAGSSGMAQAPDTSSTQNSVSIGLSSTQSANTLINLQDASGKSIVTFSPAKTYSSVVISSPEILTGTSYTAYSGGSSTGTAVDGLYSDGTYSNGTSIGSATISSVVTTIGSAAGGFGGPGQGGQGGFSGPGQGGHGPRQW